MCYFWHMYTWCIIFWYTYFVIIKKLKYTQTHTEKSFRNCIKSNWNQIGFTIIRLIWNQTDVRLVSNQSENGKYNQISGCFNKIWKRFLRVQNSSQSVTIQDGIKPCILRTGNFLQFHFFSVDLLSSDPTESPQLKSFGQYSGDVRGVSGAHSIRSPWCWEAPASRFVVRPKVEIPGENLQADWKIYNDQAYSCSRDWSLSSSCVPN